METDKLHNHDIEQSFKDIQNNLISNITLVNSFDEKKLNNISGVDLAYWQQKGIEYAVCCIVTIDYTTKQIVEKKCLTQEITVPYIPGYLSFRELPLILETYKLLEIEPDLLIFDGNGYLHYRNMGIATHASFYIKKPTIGVAKKYLKIDNVDFTMPEDIDGSYTNIIINNKIYGRALRTHKGVKPIFVSCGNFIDLDTATSIILNLIDKGSRQPIPTRLADIETKIQRKVNEGDK